MVGLGVDLGDLPDYVGHNDLATAQLLRALAAAGFAGRLVLASSMVVYGEGRYACPEHGRRPAGPRRRADLDAGRFEPPCPRCGRALVSETVPEDAPPDPRSVYAATKLAQEHLCARLRPRDGRAGHARCATTTSTGRGCRATRPTPAWRASSAPRSPPDARRGCSRTARSGATSSTSATSPGPTCSRSAGPVASQGAFNVASGTPRTVLDMATALARACAAPPAAAPQVTGEWRAGDVRHVVASPARAAERLGFVAEEDFAAGMAEFAPAPLRD